MAAAAARPTTASSSTREVADIKNIGTAATAARSPPGLFLQEFVDGAPWVHLDIAGPARSPTDDGYLAKGGTGFGVRTLVELVASFEVPTARSTAPTATARPRSGRRAGRRAQGTGQEDHREAGRGAEGRGPDAAGPRSGAQSQRVGVHEGEHHHTQGRARRERGGAGRDDRARALGAVPAGVQSSGSSKVTVGDNFFEPDDVEVTAGTKVTWTNTGKILHSVTPNKGKAFGAKELPRGKSYSFTFKKPGTYRTTACSTARRTAASTARSS